MIEPLEHPGQQYTSAWYRGHIIRWDQWFKHFDNQPNLTYLEIGVWEGRSANFMMHKYFTHPTSRGIGIDPFIQSERYPITKRNLELGVGERFELINGYSYNVLQSGGRWDQSEWIDLVYVDGDHATKPVIQDGVLAFPLVKVGGYMVFDDYHLARHGCPQGVNKFVQAYADYVDVKSPVEGSTGTALWQLMLVKKKSLPINRADWPVVI